MILGMSCKHLKQRPNLGTNSKNARVLLFQINLYLYHLFSSSDIALT